MNAGQAAGGLNFAGDFETPAEETLAAIEAELAGDPLYSAPLLSAADERELFAAYRAARTEETRKALAGQLVLANMRLSRKWARKYTARLPRGFSMTVEDLTDEGVFGLYEAIEHFDVDLGYKFSTYASWWICQAIGRAIDDQGAMIRIPVWLAIETRRAKRDTSTPDVQEAGAPKPARAPLPVVVSLDVPTDPYGDNPEDTTLLATLSDTLAGEQPAMASPTSTQAREEAIATKLSDHQALYQALGLLSARQRFVIELRYGLTDGTSRTLSEVGRGMGLSRERIRQIEARAFTVLRTALRRTSDGDVAMRELTARRLELVKSAQKMRVRPPTPITIILAPNLKPLPAPVSASTLLPLRRYA